MELRQLRYFEAVVRRGGSTRAAEALRMAQPAVSARVRGLGSELGAAAGFTPKVPYESTSVHQIRELVSHGLGLALLARSIAESPGRAVASRSVLPTPIDRPVGLRWLGGRPLGPAAQRCRGFLTSWLAPG